MSFNLMKIIKLTSDKKELKIVPLPRGYKM